MARRPADSCQLHFGYVPTRGSVSQTHTGNAMMAGAGEGPSNRELSSETGEPLSKAGAPKRREPAGSRQQFPRRVKVTNDWCKRETLVAEPRRLVESVSV
ncbi:hypothetical protein GGTG_03249 [Gaeumannomyces tritici R3-111a-1]|uniref:Uncharacterized protein n=1 Tax=Gaeumannomyces tritici (strain R3-111a-1) TaxID=644352 RepID=J3NPP2_GAET3|nr:hypothetical protein GGTG_03249 [Gaeumannomyces tritici R3-111a-1]EJT78147.1 hypothetical protein GGTG_03249 [Gaeumannomyces tritici R3-111a-1]